MAGDRRSNGPDIDASPYLPPDTEIGPYRVGSIVDRGGMAVVYEATDVRLDRQVALKVMAPDLNTVPEFRERFLREARFAAALDHPNIVPIYDAGEAAGLLYIAMRYVRGSNLGVLLRQQGPLDPGHTVALLTPVADALDAAHAVDLIHRDVKPGNILLASPGGWGGAHEYVYLADFGLTLRTTAGMRITGTGQFLGTLAYIAPEQIRGEPLDARSDLYALGCVAYECLTGVPPFGQSDPASLLWAHLNDRPPAVSHHQPDLGGADQVLARAMAKNPRDRYHSCLQFTAALSAALLGGGNSGTTIPTAVGDVPGARTPDRDGHPTGHHDPADDRGATPGAERSGRPVLTVFLVDDHEMVRRGVADLLDTEEDLAVIGQASSVTQALALIPALEPDVAVLDMRLPDGDGVHLCRELRSRMPGLRCLMLTSYTDEEAMTDAILAGAGGYVVKDIKGVDLLSAVRTVGAGSSLLDSRAAAAVRDRLRAAGRPANRSADLSEPESTVLELIGQGLTNPQIAERMSLSERAVKAYVSLVLAKLGVTRRAQAVALAAEFGDQVRRDRP
jgi:serine/threonine-protein kinase